MSVLGEHSIFSTMKQDGAFAVPDDVDVSQRFSRDRRQWVRTLGQNNSEVTKYRAVRAQIFNLLDVGGFGEIAELVGNRALRAERSRRANELLGSLFHISPIPELVTYKIHEYAQTADSVIKYLQEKLLSPYAADIELSNEIETTFNPVDLLLLFFDNRFHKKVRFEAKRKLVLMNLAGTIDQKERETDIEGKFSDFITFLNEFVWSPRFKIGDHEKVFLHSHHAPDDFACTQVEVLDAEQARAVQAGDHQLLTHLKRRRFNDGGQTIPVYVSVRKKSPAAKVLKLLRKNEKNPAAAVSDELGLMAVLDDRGAVRRFVKHLTRAALHSGSLLTLEDISDTLTGGYYGGTSVGSSSQTQMLKFFARLGNIRVEFIIHTNQSYLNYRFQRNIAHDEYEVRRIFDSDVAEFLFPRDLYNLDMERVKRRLLNEFRRRHGCPP